MVTVSVVTRDASVDSLTNGDYRDIYTELREQYTLRQFAQMATTGYSIAWWSKYEHGEVELTRPARNELRRAVGLAELPLTVGEATADVEPDAVVYRVGIDRPDVVILVHHREPIVMHLNGALTATADVPLNSHVTLVTRGRSRKSVSILPAIWQRLNQARKKASLSWDEYLLAYAEVER